MGREAGWIALESGIAGGADVILIPEIPFDINRVCQTIKRRQLTGRGFSVVVVAEGAMPIGGKQMIVQAATQEYQSVRFGGISFWVAEKIAEGTGMDTRVTVLGHLQRGGSPNAFDRLLATRFGTAAVELIAQEKFGYMVCLRGRDIKSVPIEEAVGKMKRVEPDGQIVHTAELVGIEFGRPDKNETVKNSKPAKKTPAA